MPLPSPIIDDRSYAQLAGELKARIPVYNPEWTDHNEADPGITLLEQFAFQAENLLYRMNQVPEATYLEFLRLLQIPLRPAEPARALLAFTTELPGGVPLPQRSLANAGKIEFSTLAEARAWPLSCVAACRSHTELKPEEAGTEVAEFIARTADALPAALADARRLYYETRLLDPAVIGEPLDFGSAVDGMLWDKRTARSFLACRWTFGKLFIGRKFSVFKELFALDSSISYRVTNKGYCINASIVNFSKLHYCRKVERNSFFSVNR